MEVYRLADVVNMLVERQLTVNDHSLTKTVQAPEVVFSIFIKLQYCHFL